MAKSKLPKKTANKQPQRSEGSNVVLIGVIGAAALLFLVVGFFVVKGFLAGRNEVARSNPDPPRQPPLPGQHAPSPASETPGELEKLLARIPVIYPDDDPRSSRPLVEPAKLTPVGDDEDLPQDVKDRNQQIREAPATRSLLAIDLESELDKSPELKEEGAVLELTGLVRYSSTTKEGSSVDLLTTPGIDPFRHHVGSIMCYLVTPDISHAVSRGQVIKIKGRLEEFSLRDCVIIEVGPHPAVAMTGAEFEKIFAQKGGLSELNRRLEPRELLLTGVVAEAPAGTTYKVRFGVNLVFETSLYGEATAQKYPTGAPIKLLCRNPTNYGDKFRMVADPVPLSAPNDPVPFDEAANRSLAFQVTRRTPMIEIVARPLQDPHPVDLSPLLAADRDSIAKVVEAKDAQQVNSVQLAAECLSSESLSFSDRGAVEARYKGKLLEMRGRLYRFWLTSEGKPVFHLVVSDDVFSRPAYIEFVSLHPEPWIVAALHQHVRVRGRFEGGGSSPRFVEGVILETEGPPAVVAATDEQLLTEYTAMGEEEFGRQYDRKTLLVSGTIKRIEDNKVALAGSGETEIHVFLSTYEGWDQWKGLEVGQQLRVAANIGPVYPLNFLTCFRTQLAPE